MVKACDRALEFQIIVQNVVHFEVAQFRECDPCLFVTVHGHFYLQSVINSFYLKIWWLPGVLILKPNLASICSPSWLSTIGRNKFIISVKIPQNDSVIEC